MKNASVMTVAAAQVSKSSLRGSTSASHTARATTANVSSPGKRRASVGVSLLRDDILNGRASPSMSMSFVVVGRALTRVGPSSPVAWASSRHARGTNARIASSEASSSIVRRSTAEAAETTTVEDVHLHRAVGTRRRGLL